MAETTTWAIKDWDTAFECAASRKLAKVTYLQLRCKLDGLVYRRLMRRPGGLEAYSVFMALVQVAAKCDVRGVLARDGKPLTSIDLEDLTCIPKDAIEKAIEILTLADIGWLVAENDTGPADSVLSLADLGENRSTTKPNQKEQNRTGPTNQPTKPTEPKGGGGWAAPISLSTEQAELAEELSRPPWSLHQAELVAVVQAGPPPTIRAVMDDVQADARVRNVAAVLVARVRAGNLDPPRAPQRKLGLDDPEDIAARVRARNTA